MPHGHPHRPDGSQNEYKIDTLGPTGQIPWRQDAECDETLADGMCHCVQRTYAECVRTGAEARVLLGCRARVWTPVLIVIAEIMAVEHGILGAVLGGEELESQRIEVVCQFQRPEAVGSHVIHERILIGIDATDISAAILVGSRRQHPRTVHLKESVLTRYYDSWIVDKVEMLESRNKFPAEGAESNRIDFHMTRRTAVGDMYAVGGHTP